MSDQAEDRTERRFAAVNAELAALWAVIDQVKADQAATLATARAAASAGGAV